MVYYMQVLLFQGLQLVLYNFVMLSIYPGNAFAYYIVELLHYLGIHAREMIIW